MNISFDWLRDYVDIDVSPQELADRLTLLGFEVDEVIDVGPKSLDGVVVGRVLDVRKHPDADRLVVCRVDVGDGEPSQIVCGAPNVAPGQLVPVAVPGTVLHLPDRDDPSKRVAVTLKKAKIRGQASHGMICAEDELGLSDDHSGIMVLSEDASVGEPLADHLGAGALGDTVFDIELTPNRPDATCHVGIAREVAALYDRRLRVPEVSDLPAVPDTPRVRVDIENPEGCGRYVGILVTGVKVADSPDWMARRLKAIGLRPRNNIVDITNYVMYELGQPLHGFDYDRLAKGRIVVRNAKPGMRFRTLDDTERTLDGDMLMICDGADEVAVAGVMGGENSEVSDETVNVLIESAWFDPASIRRTARALGLQTDASYRFERGVDPNGALRAALRAADLMTELAGGTTVEVVDCHPVPQTPKRLELRPEKVSRILGVELEPAGIASLLRGIGIDVAEQENRLVCTVPTFRPDVEREIDLVEEVGRRLGFDNIPAPKRTAIPYRQAKRDPVSERRVDVLRMLSGLGFREIYTNSLVSPSTAERFADLLDSKGKPVATHNAISYEMSALRPSLLPGGLQIVAHNLRHGFRDIRLMEFGHVFHAGEDSEGRPSWVDGYIERESLILLLSGASQLQSWDRASKPADLFDLKGIVDAVCTSIGVHETSYAEVRRNLAEVARDVLELSADGIEIGVLGQVSGSLLKHFDISQNVYFAELTWPSLLRAASHPQSVVRYEPVPRFPAVERDLALAIEEGVSAAALIDTIKAAGTLLSSVSIFDVYEGPELGAGMKSIAFSLSFRADRTLVDSEVDEEIDRIVGAVSSKWNARLRAK